MASVDARFKHDYRESKRRWVTGQHSGQRLCKTEHSPIHAHIRKHRMSTMKLLLLLHKVLQLRSLYVLTFSAVPLHSWRVLVVIL
jgi:hypothetical protein